MKVVIVGAGVSGLIASISQKLKHPSDDVLVIDKNNKISKKTYATGNGKCNFANTNITPISYNTPLAYKIVNDNSVKQLLSFYESVGIMIRKEGDLVYPYSNTSDSYVISLTNKATQLGVKFLLNESLIDYTNNVVITTNHTINYDRLIFATGGKSSPKFGSDGKVFDILKEHGYKINPLKPGLCPIKTMENTLQISGVRQKCNVTLISNEETYLEEGEVLFKDDGLSGIVIFNLSSLIARNKSNQNYSIALDLFKDEDEYVLLKKFQKLNESNNNFVNTLFPHKLGLYILGRCKITEKNKYSDYEIEKIIATSKHLEFTYKENYGFEDSQVSVGGLAMEEVNLRLESRKEKNVYFVGEVLDVDGLCGGYNMMFAALSALKLD